MNVFPYPLFPLICGSLCISTLSLIFSILVISIYPAIWMFPAIFIPTTLYHATTIFIFRSESEGSRKLFSLPNVIASCVLTCLWIAVCVTTVALTVLLAKGRLKDPVTPRRMWNMVVLCVCSLLESIIMGYIAVCARKERKGISYDEKWKWRTDHIPLSQWGFRNTSTR